MTRRARGLLHKIRSLGLDILLHSSKFLLVQSFRILEMYTILVSDQLLSVPTALEGLLLASFRLFIPRTFFMMTRMFSMR